MDNELFAKDYIIEALLKLMTKKSFDKTTLYQFWFAITHSPFLYNIYYSNYNILYETITIDYIYDISMLTSKFLIRFNLAKKIFYLCYSSFNILYFYSKYVYYGI